MFKKAVLSLIASLMMVQAASAGIITGIAKQFNKAIRWEEMSTGLSQAMKNSFDDIWDDGTTVTFRKGFRMGNQPSTLDGFNIRLVKESASRDGAMIRITVVTEDNGSAAAKLPQLKLLVEKAIRNVGLKQEVKAHSRVIGYVETEIMSLNNGANNVKVAQFIEEMASLGERVKTEGLINVLAN